MSQIGVIDSATHTTVTTHTITNHEFFKQASADMGWRLDEQSTQKGITYYNPSNMCMMNLEQGNGAYVMISFKNAADPNMQILHKTMASSLADGLKVSIDGMAQYQNFNPFQQMNNF